MNVILLSGGSGFRLWPLSNQIRSKQFLKLFKSDESTNYSMLQRTLHFLNQSGIASQIIIAAGEQQKEILCSQIGDSMNIDLVIEPERRNTFPAIALSVSYLLDKKGITDDETIAVMPVDQFTEYRYFEILANMDKAIHDEIAELMLIGVYPKYPSDQFGYILPSDEKAGGCFLVNKFIEKPPLELARELIGKGAFWNGGVFAFKAGYIKSFLYSILGTCKYDEVLVKYSLLPKISFDYAVVEVVKSVAMVPYEGTWKDLGTWDVLTQELDSHCIGNGMLHGCKGTYVINELPLPLHAIDVNDQVIIASRDGILVTSKAGSWKLRDYSAYIESTINYSESDWGCCSVIEKTHVNSTSLTIQKLQVNKGNKTSLRENRFGNVTMIITDGIGLLTKGDTDYEISNGSIFNIECNQSYYLTAYSQILAIEVLTSNGAYSIGNDEN